MRVMWPQPHRNIPRKSSSLLHFFLLPPVEVEVCHEKPRTERVSLFARAKMYSSATAPVVNRESEVLNTRKVLK
ncbi:hypothetical protein Tc00.1047053504229.37 [Trypanosoma cruzi]|uniref:Uncharacterized protein n=1 Tax=Trypanosoma cruzi (strain CL Brener) TaxID=353153 RepID=Q4DCW5_TRYCC|nr:hypothetical protein Tc00.1047053504229.37 [Trypanosoma cruzi]EAN90369.1 hypothetical protein Tc00.1047053504229.37 [Trypanosoma cruzi]|eukprot:XP_812220.1 hypothetical protein [Trypanosoma cruzi strain CL Brener]